MFLTKVKIATALILVVAGILATSSAVFMHPALAGKQPEPEAGTIQAQKDPSSKPQAAKEKDGPKNVLDRAAANANEIRDDAEKAYAMMLLGKAQAVSGNSDAAAKTFREAVAVAKKN